MISHSNNQLNKQEMNVSKVKLDRNAATIEYTDSFGNSITHKGDFMPHPDFVAAMSRLTEHFCALTEQAEVIPLDADKFGEAPELEKVLEHLHVTAVQVKSAESGEKAIISGYRVLSNGRNLSLQTPATNLDTDDYEKQDELSSDIDGVFSEAEQYVQGKHGGFEQKTLDFDGEEGVDPFDEAVE